MKWHGFFLVYAHAVQKGERDHLLAVAPNGYTYETTNVANATKFETREEAEQACLAFKYAVKGLTRLTILQVEVPQEPS